MKGRKIMGLAAVGAAATLAIAACGGSSSSGNGTSSFNAAVTQVVNPSSHKGGTISFGLTSTPDSTDPGNTYYAFMWNFSRLYTMPLMTYKSCPGKCGLAWSPTMG
jgi:peptide/nickel transport system substrate-binding protein